MGRGSFPLLGKEGEMDPDERGQYALESAEGGGGRPRE